ncbi:MAG: PIG-L deacetylase family protein [Actinomycetes bacterium]
MSRTLVAFHAHPDDEVLLTGGTLARLAAEGHRVVLLVATAGGAGLAASRFGGPDSLAARRLAELRESARILGCARVEVLGYADSGMDGELRPDGELRGDDDPTRDDDDTVRNAFCRQRPDDVAERVADLLREEQADALTVYDPAGGYGHPDHRQVHRVGTRAAVLAGTPVVLEATVDRVRLQRALSLLRWLPGIPSDFHPARFDRAFTPRERLTHRIDVRQFADLKRAAMAAHVSQATSDSGERSLAVCLRLPVPVFRLAFGYEWFVQQGAAPSRRLRGEVFDEQSLDERVQRDDAGQASEDGRRRA